ncbi:MAG: FHA domain-containing protein [Lentisphaeria bacterium]|nr:FHA domain-containing protein [Lentisphaeria bacterium]
MNLYFLNGTRKGEQWELVPPGICIGREADNDIQLLIAGVSRYHAKIEYTPDGKWKIMDLGSTNGTKVNGTKITQPQLLEPGMEIIIGEQIIRYDQNFEEPVAVRPSPAQPVVIPVGKPASSGAPILKPVPAGTIPEAQPAEAHNLTEKMDFDLFSGKKKTAPAGPTPETGSNSGPKKRITNLLFALLVTVMVCVVIAVFVYLSGGKQNPAEKKAVQSVRNPFFLEYEKTIRSKDNVFRFSVVIENDSARFQLNDLKYQRKFVKGIKSLDADLLKELKRKIQGTDFMKITSEPPGSPENGVDECRTLTIGYDSNLNSVTVRNNYPLSSFETIENAINRFADGYGLKTISLSQKEMREEAERSFLKAEELFANYQARPENLRNAILRYQITIDFLDQFDPKPQQWITAKRKLTEAEQLMHKAIKDAEFNINVLYKKKDYAGAVSECGKLLLIIDPEHKSYQKIRDLKITLEKKLAEQKKKRKN